MATNSVQTAVAVVHGAAAARMTGLAMTSDPKSAAQSKVVVRMRREYAEERPAK
jgi:hypothetical protein